MKKESNLTIRSEYISFLNAFNSATCGEGKFVIPQYQRFYSWTEKNISEMLKTIEKIMEDPIEIVDYFFGVVITSRDDKNVKIVDGQQRLTSLSLLVAAVYRVLKEMVFEKQRESRTVCVGDYVVVEEDAHPNDEKNFLWLKDFNELCELGQVSRSSAYRYKAGDKLNATDLKEHVYAALSNIAQHHIWKTHEKSLIIDLADEEYFEEVVKGNDPKTTMKGQDRGLLRSRLATNNEMVYLWLSKQIEMDKPYGNKYAGSVIRVLSKILKAAYRLHVVEVSVEATSPKESDTTLREYEIFINLNSKGKDLEQYDHIKAKLLRCYKQWTHEVNKSEDTAELSKRFNKEIFHDVFNRKSVFFDENENIEEDEKVFTGENSLHNQFFACYIAYYLPETFRSKGYQLKNISENYEEALLNVGKLIKETDLMSKEDLWFKMKDDKPSFKDQELAKLKFFLKYFLRSINHDYLYEKYGITYCESAQLVQYSQPEVIKILIASDTLDEAANLKEETGELLKLISRYNILLDMSGAGIHPTEYLEGIFKNTKEMHDSFWKINDLTLYRNSLLKTINGIESETLRLPSWKKIKESLENWGNASAPSRNKLACYRYVSLKLMEKESSLPKKEWRELENKIYKNDLAGNDGLRFVKLIPNNDEAASTKPRRIVARLGEDEASQNFIGTAAFKSNKFLTDQIGNFFFFPKPQDKQPKTAPLDEVIKQQFPEICDGEMNFVRWKNSEKFFSGKEVTAESIQNRTATMAASWKQLVKEWGLLKE